MREVNFSIPSVNKASVGITTALYDRRALDCTSTLPLINSLNHLAYLTTSSARIRDILTVDGGVERLVCILKQGRSEESMEKWKWNLAFQCVVNIGVRGSESVRTRVVEADMVPVIATILDNYVKAIDKIKEKSDAENERLNPGRRGHRSSSRSSRRTEGSEEAAVAAHASRRSTRPPLADIMIPPTTPTRHRSRTYENTSPRERTIEVARQRPTINTPGSPPETLSAAHGLQSARPRLLQHDRNLSETSVSSSSSRPAMHPARPPSVDTHLLNEATRELGLRPVRDSDRLPSMLPSVGPGVTSQPESPTTPMAPIPPSIQHVLSPVRDRRRPSARQHASASIDLEDADADQSPAEMEQGDGPQEGEPMVDIQTEDTIDAGTQSEAILNIVTQPPELATTAGSETQEVETLNLPHAPAQDGSIIQTHLRPPPAVHTPTPGQPTTTEAMSSTVHSPSPSSNSVGSRYSVPTTAHPAVVAATPREEDVIMSLQLLAYVSKYCNLRTYFQNSHLVPALEVGVKLRLLDQELTPELEREARERAEVEEYLLTDDYNIFPLVEKFTVRHHSTDMQYWAGVVMRNLCRKDESRGGIRQCAYYKCGKWEQFTRQFAKCRRCRRTKYCSKECQKNAWVYHRHWCQVATQ